MTSAGRERERSPAHARPCPPGSADLPAAVAGFFYRLFFVCSLGRWGEILRGRGKGVGHVISLLWRHGTHSVGILGHSWKCFCIAAGWRGEGAGWIGRITLLSLSLFCASPAHITSRDLAVVTSQGLSFFCSISNASVFFFFLSFFLKYFWRIDNNNNLLISLHRWFNFNESRLKLNDSFQVVKGGPDSDDNIYSFQFESTTLVTLATLATLALDWWSSFGILIDSDELFFVVAAKLKGWRRHIDRMILDSGISATSQISHSSGSNDSGVHHATETEINSWTRRLRRSPDSLSLSPSAPVVYFPAAVAMTLHIIVNHYDLLLSLMLKETVAKRCCPKCPVTRLAPGFLRALMGVR